MGLGLGYYRAQEEGGWKGEINITSNCLCCQWATPCAAYRRMRGFGGNSLLGM